MIRYYIQKVVDGDISGPPEELITCQYCKWYENDKKHVCGIGKGLMFEENYCSDGEWKEDHDPR